jgi:hypothetical protein
MRENDRSRNNGGGKNVIYMGLISGPNNTDDTCGKTTVTGTMDRGFTVCIYIYVFKLKSFLRLHLPHITLQPKF